MVVSHNILAMNASRQYGIVNRAKTKSSEKLSSGYKINRAADDAAGLSISEKMRKQIRGLDRASVNAQDGISAVQTADGALHEVHSMLHRMNELSVQAANGTNSTTDLLSIQAEVNQLIGEINRISDTTDFNDMHIFKGDAHNVPANPGSASTISSAIYTSNGARITSPEHLDRYLAGGGIVFTDTNGSAGSNNIAHNGDQYTYTPATAAIDDPFSFSIFVGHENEEANSITIDIDPMDAYHLGVDPLDVSSNDAAKSALTKVHTAIEKLSSQRGSLGAVQNRLEHTVDNLDNIVENVMAAESRIRDTDMAEEMVSYSRDNILLQAGNSMLAQANQMPEGVLSLLQ